MNTAFLRQRLIHSMPTDPYNRDVPIESGNPSPAGAIEGIDREISLKELLRVFRRQFGFILLVVIILTAPIALYALRLEPKYTAVASVVVEPRPQLLLLADGWPAAQPPDPAYLETLASVVRSSTFTSQAIEEFDLLTDPEFLPAPANVLDRLRSWVSRTMDSGSFSENPFGNTMPEVDWLETMAIFDDRLQVRPQSQSYVIKISFTSQDPKKSAMIANRLAEQFIEMQLAEKSDAVQRAIDGISGRLSVAQQVLKQAEQEVADIRLENNFVPGQSVSVSHMQAEEIARSLFQMQASYALVNAKLDVIEALQNNEAGFEDLMDVNDSPVVSQLRLNIIGIEARVEQAEAAYGKEHPLTKVVRKELETANRKRNEEIDRVFGGVRNEATIIAAQIRELEKQLTEATGRSALDSDAAVRLESAERNAAVKRSHYDALLRRLEETKVQERWLTPDVRLVSKAAPPLEPSTPSQVNLISAGASVSLVLALLMAFLREQMDSSLRSNRQVERELGIPCLGLVPKVKHLSHAPTPYVLRAPRSSYTQSVGAVWAQIRIALPTAKVVLVTSAFPREGTSSLAENLAYCARQSDDLRTALVDFDLLSSRGGTGATRDDTPGVADLLQQGGLQPLSLDDAARKNPKTGIDVFPAGKRRHGTIEMSGDEEIAALLDNLREHYDIIFIDAPPLLGVSDARRLAFFADTSLLVIRWGSTSIEVASSALQILSQARAHVVGAVLTQVDARRQSLYGKGDGVQYGRNFRQYHST